MKTKSLNSPYHWSVNEIEFLEINYNLFDIYYIQSSLYNLFFRERSIESIRVKACRLGLINKE